MERKRVLDALVVDSHAHIWAGENSCEAYNVKEKFSCSRQKFTPYNLMKDPDGGICTEVMQAFNVEEQLLLLSVDRDKSQSCPWRDTLERLVWSPRTHARATDAGISRERRAAAWGTRPKGRVIRFEDS